MDKFINTSIYLIYAIIALISIVISYKVSVVMSLIVLAIESVRLVSLYKKVYSVILLVFVLNVGLIGYNSFKSQQAIDYKNNQIIKNNEVLSNYTKTKDLRASTLKDLSSGIKELEEISIDWWLLVGVYLFLELSLILLITGINRQEKLQLKKEQDLMGKPAKKVEKPREKQASKPIANKGGDNLEYVGSFRQYAKEKGITVRGAEEIFKKLKAENRLIKQNGKNYIRS